MNPEQLKIEHRVMTYAIAVLCTITTFYARRTYTQIDAIQDTVNSHTVQISNQEWRLQNAVMSISEHKQATGIMFDKIERQIKNK